MPNFDSNYFTAPGTSAQVRLRLVLTPGEQQIVNNRTRVAWSLRMVKGAAGYPSRNFNDCIASVTINGSNVYSSSNRNYTFTSGSQTITVSSGNVWVNHDADGTKTFSFSASYNGHSPLGTASLSSSMALPTIPRASEFTLDPTSSTIDMGTEIDIDIDTNSSGFQHTVTYDFAGGAATGTIASGLTGSTPGTSWTPAISTFAPHIPNATTGPLKIDVLTHASNGTTLLGTKSKTISLRVPTSGLPTISSITDEESVSAIEAAIGAYVQGSSKPTLGIAGAAGYHGSTISTYRLQVAGQTINAASGTVPNAIAASGTVVVTATVTDSRGRTGTLTKNLEVLPYAPPAIASITAQRSDNEGVVDEVAGTYVRVDIDAAVQSLEVDEEEKNELSYRISSRETGTPTWTVKTGPTGVDDISLSGFVLVSSYDITDSFEILVEIMDEVATSGVIRTIATGSVLVHFDSDLGLGINGYRTQGALDVHGDIYQGGEKVVDESYEASESSRGLVELATNAEVAAGTDVARVITSAGAASVYGVGFRRLTPIVYDSSGSFVKAPYVALGCTHAEVECVGSGGGGGGSGATNDRSGGCGGAGATARKIVALADLADVEPVTVPAGGAGGGGGSGSPGGTASLGTHVAADGGGAGSQGAGGSAMTGGDGATTGTGDVVISGGDGSNGTSVRPSGLGGASTRGGGGRSGNGDGEAGFPGRAPGSGGGGGRRVTTSANGGPGERGEVVIIPLIGSDPTL